MLRAHLLVSLAVLVAACGDDGFHRLDAPDELIDAPTDAAPDAPDPKVALNVVVAGLGTGTVTSSPAGIVCTTASCSADFDQDTVVTLTAVPGTGSTFAGWSDACAGTAPTCDVTLAQAATVTATFDVARYAVTVTKAGVGSGVVAGSGLDCGTTCTVMVDHGTVLSLTATPANLSVFAGWGGACSGTADCLVTVTDATTISANFALDDVTLFVSKGGNGSGVVTATGINCGADCSETYTAGQLVTLTAAAATGSTFTGWSGGGCTGTSTCMVTMTAATTVTATFTLQQFALTVTRGGNGTGSVVSNPTGIACGADCTESYDYNTMVALTATPTTGSAFSGWSGACTGTGPCIVAMTAAKAVAATFTLQQFPLTVTATGNGTVTSAPAGVACPTDCSQSYDYGTTVTMSAAAATGWTFTGWGGACTGTATCSVTMTAAKSVSATFTIQTFTLSTSRSGTGSGAIASTPAGINCGVDCMESYSFGQVVALTATPAAGSSFTGWSGACTGPGACAVTMDAAKSATASFTLMAFPLTVTKAGSGSGTVVSSPAGISCGATCGQTFDYGTAVSLTASATTGSTFAGWSGGGCTGTGTCVTTVTAATSVTATFTVNSYLLTVTPAGTGTGTVTSSPAGISCGGDCSEPYVFNTMVTLTAIATSTTSDFAGWSGGGCTGTGTCTVAMRQATTVIPTFTLKQMALRVTKSGDGAGTVSGNGVSCGATCTVSLPYGTVVTLTAAPDSSTARLSTFTGWTGAGCTGTGSCSFTITATTTVNAAFKLRPNLLFTTSGTFDGNLGGIAGADARCKAAAMAKNLPGNYRAYISGAATVAPTRFAGVSGWVRVDNAPVMNAISQFGGGTLFNPPVLDEGGTNLARSASPYVWTATKADGTYFGQNCDGAGALPDWSTTGARTTTGILTQTNSDVVDGGGVRPCGELDHLYCLGIDRPAVAR